MSLLAETIVEEYFNYHGYFTIRGVKRGNDEIDILAIKVSNKKKHEAIHIEVQVSEKPVKYISNLTEEIKKAREVKSNSSAIKRTDDELKSCVELWVKKKFNHPHKKKIREKLYPKQEWKFLFVHGRVKEEKELSFLRECSVSTCDINILIEELAQSFRKKYGTSSVGRDIINIFKLFFEKEIKIAKDQAKI